MGAKIQQKVKNEKWKVKNFSYLCTLKTNYKYE